LPCSRGHPPSGLSGGIEIDYKMRCATHKCKHHALASCPRGRGGPATPLRGSASFPPQSMQSGERIGSSEGGSSYDGESEPLHIPTRDPLQCAALSRSLWMLIGNSLPTTAGRRPATLPSRC